MKRGIFDRFLQEVIKHFRITAQDITKKNADKNTINARQTLVYLCRQRGMTNNEITEWLNDIGYECIHAHNSYSFRAMQIKIGQDEDIQILVDRINNNVTI